MLYRDSAAPKRIVHGLTLVAVALLCTACARGRGRLETPQNRPALWPVTHPSRCVTSEFGMRQHPIGGRYRHHNGIDIAVPQGTPVKATAWGEVIFSGQQTGYGKIVGVDHANGFETWYAHLKKRKANVGKRVKRGEVIGLVGATGNATGPHLHYEIRQGGKPVNPRPFLP